MAMPASVEQQTRNAFATIRRVLDEAGSSLADVVRATYYVVDHADADRVLPICGEHFAEIRPATTLLVVSGLYRPEMKVEIEVTARRHGA
jgi:enamine deaminase RidA (YjgF/YER057c/UK114 family)